MYSLATTEWPRVDASGFDSRRPVLYAPPAYDPVANRAADEPPPMILPQSGKYLAPLSFSLWLPDPHQAISSPTRPAPTPIYYTVEDVASGDVLAVMEAAVNGQTIELPVAGVFRIKAQCGSGATSTVTYKLVHRSSTIPGSSQQQDPSPLGPRQQQQILASVARGSGGGGETDAHFRRDISHQLQQPQFQQTTQVQRIVTPLDTQQQQQQQHHHSEERMLTPTRDPIPQQQQRASLLTPTSAPEESARGFTLPVTADRRGMEPRSELPDPPEVHAGESSSPLNTLVSVPMDMGILLSPKPTANRQQQQQQQPGMVMLQQHQQNMEPQPEFEEVTADDGNKEPEEGGGARVARPNDFYNQQREKIEICGSPSRVRAMEHFSLNLLLTDAAARRAEGHVSPSTRQIKVGVSMEWMMGERDADATMQIVEAPITKRRRAVTFATLGRDVEWPWRTPNAQVGKSEDGFSSAIGVNVSLPHLANRPIVAICRETVGPSRLHSPHSGFSFRVATPFNGTVALQRASQAVLEGEASSLSVRGDNTRIIDEALHGFCLPLLVFNEDATCRVCTAQGKSPILVAGVIEVVPGDLFEMFLTSTDVRTGVTVERQYQLCFAQNGEVFFRHEVPRSIAAQSILPNGDVPSASSLHPLYPVVRGGVGVASTGPCYFLSDFRVLTHDDEAAVEVGRLLWRGLEEPARPSAVGSSRGGRGGGGVIECRGVLRAWIVGCPMAPATVATIFSDR